MFQDELGRTIRYLRLSLTPACQMRCVYCRPKKITTPTGPSPLSPDEIEQMVRHMIQRHGLRKVRLTGGDPTANKDLVKIIQQLGALTELDDLAMTTNGLNLSHMAQTYADAGLKRINLSLDSLNPKRFARMTGVDGLSHVLKGIDAAKAAGLWPIKLNTVVLKNENECELPDLVQFAAEHDMPIRFIELMPMGPLADQWTERYVPESQMRKRLESIVHKWHCLPQGSDSARQYRVELKNGHSAKVGFITPMSCNFCSACNRIRITSDGTLYPCLMDQPAGSLLQAIRPHFDGEQFDDMLAQSLAVKAAEHPVTGFVTMTNIGG